MGDLEIWLENLKQVGLKNESVAGLAYITACLPTVLYFSHKLNIEYLKPLVPYLKDPGKATLDTYGEEEKFSALRIFDKFYRTAKISPVLEPNEILSPVLDEDFSQALSERNIQLFVEEQKQPNLNFNPKQKNDTYNSLILFIGKELTTLIPVNRILDIFQIGFEHSAYWMTDDCYGESYLTSVLGSNYVPSYLGTIINSLPYPNSFSSNINNWMFSRELDYRIKEDDYDFDLETQTWIWKLHNYIFYTSETSFPEREDKYKDQNISTGFNEMLSDVFLNIIKFNNAFPLKSESFDFNPRFTSRDDWSTYVNEVNFNFYKSCGWNVNELHISCIGELYHIMSYRFLTAVLIYLDRK